MSDVVPTTHPTLCRISRRWHTRHKVGCRADDTPDLMSDVAPTTYPTWCRGLLFKYTCVNSNLCICSPQICNISYRDARKQLNIERASILDGILMAHLDRFPVPKNDRRVSTASLSSSVKYFFSAFASAAKFLSFIMSLSVSQWWCCRFCGCIKCGCCCCFCWCPAAAATASADSDNHEQRHRSWNPSISRSASGLLNVTSQPCICKSPDRISTVYITNYRSIVIFVWRNLHSAILIQQIIERKFLNYITFPRF